MLQIKALAQGYYLPVGRPRCRDQIKGTVVVTHVTEARPLGKSGQAAETRLGGGFKPGTLGWLSGGFRSCLRKATLPEAIRLRC